MGDIDQALARAYARRGPAESSGIAPHRTSPSRPRPRSSGPRRLWTGRRPSGLSNASTATRFDRLADALIVAGTASSSRFSSSRVATGPKAGRPWS